MAEICTSIRLRSDFPAGSTNTFYGEIRNRRTVAAFFPRDAQPRELWDYSDYMESSCVCSILYYDCNFLEIYVKDTALLQMLKRNIGGMYPISLTYKTNLNDDRERFI